jgi:hypothetical protein
MFNLTRIFGALIALLLGGAAPLVGQTQSAAPAAPLPASTDSSYPEQGYLSPSRYTNQYFGFTFELPVDTHLRPTPLPASRNGSIQILELDGPPPADAEVFISAIPTASGNKLDAKTYLRQTLDQELYRGVEELRGLTKASFASHQFYLFETRMGIEQHVLLATTIGDYILQVVVAGHDEKTVKRLETSFEHLAFFPPTDLRRFVQSDSNPYDGPSVSSHRLALLEEDPPAKQIDPGKISGDFYENAMLGFSYRVPQGWVLKQEGRVQPAIETYRAKEDLGRPRMGRSEHILMDSCSRTLFSVWAKAPEANGQASYDDFGEVTVSAIAMSCFPTLQFPKGNSDVSVFRDFVAQFALTHPIVDDMGKGKVFEQNGIVFIYLHGTVAFQVPDDELSRRLSLAMAITERRGYLLTWFFAAPHDSELQGLTNERAIFDDGPSVNVASAGQPAGGGKSNGATDPASFNATDTLQTAAPASATAPANSESGSPAAASPAPSASTTAAPAASDQQGTADSSAGDHPSLLRPGESMQSQQGKGAPVVKPK